ncbi:MAG: ABC transporter ATP-binding protein [Anaerolineae bacterium]
MHGGWWAYLRYDESQRPDVDRRLVRRVVAWARPYFGHVAAMLALLLTVSLIELVPPLLYGDLIRRLGPGGGLDMRRLNLLAAGLLGVPIASSLLGVIQRRISAQIGEGIIYDLRVAMYAHMQRMSLRFFTETKTGEIISRFSNDVVGAQGAVTNTLPNLITNVLTVVTTLAIMLRLDWRLAAVSIVALPLFLLPTKRVGRMLRTIRREAAVHDAEMSSRIQETLNVSGALLVRTFGRGHFEVGRFEKAARAIRDVGIRRAVVGRLFFFGLGVATALGTALMYWAGGYLALSRGTIDAGTIVTFAAYVNRLYGPISALSNLQVEFATSLVSFERVFAYLDLPIEIASPAKPAPAGHIEGRVAFDRVGFAYLKPTGEAGEARPWALQDIDFAVDPGQVAALVGPSGAGKTTIGYLVARLYDPTTGRVLLDNHDLRTLSLDVVQRHVGVVSQETYLFHDTVRGNLAFAKPKASFSEIQAACEAANIRGVVEALPQGYDTLVGERGYRLSGGEKQRLALARVILKDPTVLVLDEATSHLDSQSEALVQEALDRVMRGRTSLVIAHRLSTVHAADMILVVQGGRIVQRGTHAELVSAPGLYAELYETQFKTSPRGEAEGSAVAGAAAALSGL